MAPGMGMGMHQTLALQQTLALRQEIQVIPKQYQLGDRIFFRDIKRLNAYLNEEKINYSLIGGTAVQVYLAKFIGKRLPITKHFLYDTDQDIDIVVGKKDAEKIRDIEDVCRFVDLKEPEKIGIPEETIEEVIGGTQRISLFPGSKKALVLKVARPEHVAGLKLTRGRWSDYLEVFDLINRARIADYDFDFDLLERTYNSDGKKDMTFPNILESIRDGVRSRKTD